MDIREAVTISSLHLRNAAGTILSTITNTATAARTWTIQDKNYTFAGLDDLTALASTLNPIGTIREFNVATNPATLLGFGTWVAHGTGRVTVAIDASQTEFDVLNETGGAKTHTLTVPEMPAHSHGSSLWKSGSTYPMDGLSGNNLTLGNTDSAGGGAAHNNLQPYIVVYRWVRTA